MDEIREMTNAQLAKTDEILNETLSKIKAGSVIKMKAIHHRLLLIMAKYNSCNHSELDIDIKELDQLRSDIENVFNDRVKTHQTALCYNNVKHTIGFVQDYVKTFV